MPLKAMQIISEEFERAQRILKAPAAEPEIVLSNLEDAIVQRIEKECLELPEEILLTEVVEEPDFDIRKDDDCFDSEPEDVLREAWEELACADLEQDLAEDYCPPVGRSRNPDIPF